MKLKANWLSISAWGVAFLLVAALGWVAFNVRAPARAAAVPTPISLDFGEPGNAALPVFQQGEAEASISRQIVPDTIIPSRARVDVITYTVEEGDSVFGIANAHNIAPETLLWANYSILNDNPDFLEPGMELLIPPIDGVYYQWKAGDTLEEVAAEYGTSVDAIVNWVGNELDLTNPTVEQGSWIMLPGGHREFRQWLVPTIARGNAGVSAAVYGPGACQGPFEGAYGTGTFVWPTPIHELVGNDYWSGHLGVDLASGDGVPVYASDSGVVVFSGWANGGYGNMIMIDHGNGYQTVYAHLSQVLTVCGQSVGQGETIAYGGSTGNSTGPHLHFEVRYEGGFINPWFVLPPA